MAVTHVSDRAALQRAAGRVPPLQAVSLSLLHLPRADIKRVQTQGWPLAYEAGEHRLQLEIPLAAQLHEFQAQLRELGFTKPLVDLMRWACDNGVTCILFDAGIEPSDRLLVFVG
jgi:hypothetical protein